MTAKEKAIELTDKIKPLVTTWDCYWDTPQNPDLVLKDAKKCAIICVDEIIKVLDIPNNRSERAYWQEVKSELNTL